MLNPAENHRLIADRFPQLVDGVRDWQAPTPVAEWVAIDVVRHILDWFPPFLHAATGLHLPTGPSVETEPTGAWRRRTEDIQDLLEAAVPPMFHHPRVGPMPFDHAVDSFYTVDVFMHSWDLARATGQDDRLDPETCATMLAGMEPMEDAIRAYGRNGPRVAVPTDASAQDRLIAFIGRDPNWHPPTR